MNQQESKSRKWIKRGIITTLLLVGAAILSAGYVVMSWVSRHG